MSPVHSVCASVRQEVQNYLRSAEYLISDMAHGARPRLSDIERDLVEFCTKELAKLLEPTPGG